MQIQSEHRSFLGRGFAERAAGRRNRDVNACSRFADIDSSRSRLPDRLDRPCRTFASIRQARRVRLLLALYSQSIGGPSGL